jgi:hypothetical protein
VVPWLGNGAQKVAAEKLCRNRWLFDLDADEIVSEELSDEIKELFRSGEPAHAAYWVMIDHTSPIDGATKLGDAPHLKLYDRQRASAPDDALGSNVKEHEGESTGHLKGRIRHHMFANARDLMNKMNRRSTRNAILGKKIGLQKLRLRILFGLPSHVAKQLFVRGMVRGGTYGFAMAMMVGFGKWLRDVKLYEEAKGLIDDVTPET